MAAVECPFLRTPKRPVDVRDTQAIVAETIAEIQSGAAGIGDHERDFALLQHRIGVSSLAEPEVPVLLDFREAVASLFAFKIKFRID